MIRIKKDIDIVETYAKNQMLKDIAEDELIALFKKSYKESVYKSASPQSTTLDQQFVISLTEKEKDTLRADLLNIQKTAPKTRISHYIRQKSLNQVDIVEWSECAAEGLKRLASKEYDEKNLLQTKKHLLMLIDRNEDESDDDIKRENFITLTGKLNDTDRKLEELKRSTERKLYRLIGRVTFNESNFVRWRAYRLSLTISDYLRFVLFDYKPNTFADRCLSVNARKRFYFSILDIYKNGWGEPPHYDKCSKCEEYLEEIKQLRLQLERYQALEKARKV